MDSTYAQMLMQRMQLNSQHQNDFANSLAQAGQTVMPLVQQGMKNQEANRQLSPAEQFLADVASGRDHHEAFAAAMQSKMGVPNLPTGGSQDTAGGLSSFGDAASGGGAVDTVGGQSTSGPSPQAVNDTNVEPSLFKTQRDLDAVKGLASPINRYDAALMAELGRNSRTAETEAGKDQRSANSIGAKKDIAAQASADRLKMHGDTMASAYRQQSLQYAARLAAIKQSAQNVLARGGSARDIALIKAQLDDVKSNRALLGRLRTGVTELTDDPKAAQDAADTEAKLTAGENEVEQMLQQAKTVVGSNPGQKRVTTTTSGPAVGATQLNSLFGLGQ